MAKIGPGPRPNRPNTAFTSMQLRQDCLKIQEAIPSIIEELGLELTDKVRREILHRIGKITIFQWIDITSNEDIEKNRIRYQVRPDFHKKELVIYEISINKCQVETI